ncbi:MAG: flagellar export protein FliJ [Chitinivibrionales bacterium]|nr:flagellar export protein FliJ [Chitinivibrionales bacterium]
MRRFLFRLEPVLQMRKRREDSVKRDLARKNGEIDSARKTMNSLTGELQNLQEQEKMRRATTSDIIGLRHSVSYRHKLKIGMLRQGRLIDRLRKEAGDIRQDLVDAKKEARAVELLKEKQLVEWRKNYRLEEQKFIDDISQQQYIRRQSATQKDRSA